MLLLGGSGVALAALLRVRRFAEFLLAVYVIAFAEIVGLTLALSLFGALTRASLLGAAAVVFAIAASLWLLAGSPRPPAPPASVFRSLGAPLLALAVVATIAIAYVTALVTATEPNGWDQQAYHLTRVAFWLQSERVGYIEHAYDERLNLNPVHGELALAFVLGVTREEVLTGLVQVFAWYANGRRAAVGTDGTWLFPLSGAEWTPIVGWAIPVLLAALAGLAYVGAAASAGWPRPARLARRRLAASRS